jgi:hypothetical protein
MVFTKHDIKYKINDQPNIDTTYKLLSNPTLPLERLALASAFAEFFVRGFNVSPRTFQSPIITGTRRIPVIYTALKFMEILTKFKYMPMYNTPLTPAPVSQARLTF